MKNGKLFSGVICLESASYLNKLSSFPPIKMQIWTDKVPIHNSILTFVKTDKISLEDTEQIAENLYITNMERTICEMIENGVTEEFICQSLEAYLSSHTQNQLLLFVNKYTSQEKYNYYLTLYDEYLQGEF
jgi:hypothetical protein